MQEMIDEEEHACGIDDGEHGIWEGIACIRIEEATYIHQIDRIDKEVSLRYLEKERLLLLRLLRVDFLRFMVPLW